MQLGTAFPLTLTLSPRERELLSPTWEYSLNSEHFPALPRLLPLPEGEGWGEGEGRVLLNSHHNSSFPQALPWAGMKQAVGLKTADAPRFTG